MRVPPQLVWSIPTGTPSSARSFFAKKYPTAEKLGVFFAPAGSHAPSTSSLRVGEMAFWTLNIRSCGSSIFASSSAPTVCQAMAHSMLDCPEHTQTSPISTSLMVMALLPRTWSVNGPPAGILGRIASHSPASSALTVRWLLPKKTVTASPGAALPQSLMGALRWSTMPSEITLGSVTSADAAEARAASAAPRRIACFFTLPPFAEPLRVSFPGSSVRFPPAPIMGR
jgi:hypothetical protein